MFSLSYHYFIFSAIRLLTVLALDNGLAITPQMGWNTWMHFGCDYDADLVLNSAKAIIANNLPEFGYKCTSHYIQRD